MSHDTTTAGYDPNAASPRAGDDAVQWPILAQLPWLGDAAEEPAVPQDILPFASAPQPYDPPTLAETANPASPLRLVDEYGAGNDDLAMPPSTDRRLHPPRNADRPIAEPPHLSFPHETSETTFRQSPGESRPAVARSAAAPRQHRRFDPPQSHRSERIALHQTEESLAARLYQWQAVRRPQLALTVVAALVLTTGGLAFVAVQPAANEPRRVADPPAWEIQPIPSVGASESLAAPLPATPPLDLSGGAPVGVHRELAPVEPAPPLTDDDSHGVDDPIAAWLNDQPVLPQLSTAGRSAVSTSTKATPPAAAPAEEAKEAEQAAMAEAGPAFEVSTPLSPDQSIVPTPASSITANSTLAPTLIAPYPTTPYPPFPTSFPALTPTPAAMAWPPAVAETPGTMFEPPQPPR